MADEPIVSLMDRANSNPLEEDVALDIEIEQPAATFQNKKTYQTA